jgi:hypothetical protein
MDLEILDVVQEDPEGVRGAAIDVDRVVVRHAIGRQVDAAMASAKNEIMVDPDAAGVQGGDGGNADVPVGDDSAGIDQRVVMDVRWHVERPDAGGIR